MNDEWKDAPDSEGLWWSVDPAVPHRWDIHLVRRDGRTGELTTVSVGHMVPPLAPKHPFVFPEAVKWVKAIPPVFHWPRLKNEDSA